MGTGGLLQGGPAAGRDRHRGPLTTKQILVEQSDVAWRALRQWKDSASDLSDALIGELSIAAGCKSVATFDKGASKLAGFEQLR